MKILTWNFQGMIWSNCFNLQFTVTLLLHVFNVSNFIIIRFSAPMITVSWNLKHIGLIGPYHRWSSAEFKLFIEKLFLQILSVSLGNWTVNYVRFQCVSTCMWVQMLKGSTFLCLAQVENFIILEYQGPTGPSFYLLRRACGWAFGPSVGPSAHHLDLWINNHTVYGRFR